MKNKLFLSIGALAIAAVAMVNIHIVANCNQALLSDLTLSKIEALSACENSIVENGQIITVTVCKRKTNLVGMIVGFKCNATSEEKCTFTNTK
jgi:hypothetical protein